jgi:rod shape determining protein RodA
VKINGLGELHSSSQLYNSRPGSLLSIDLALLICAIVLTVFGILFIYSSGVTSAGTVVDREYVRQIIFGAAGIVIAIVLAFVNYHRLYNLAIYLYLATIALLIYTCLFGRVVNGARSWLGIGSFGIQPSEFAKITTVIMLAQYLDASRKTARGLVRFVTASAIVLLPMGITLLQPDFGTSLVFIPILLVTTFVGGLPARYVFFLIGSIGLGGLLLVLPLWQSNILHNAFPILDILTNTRFIIIAGFGITLVLLIALFGLMRYKRRYFYWIAYAASMLVIALGISYAGHKVLVDYQIMRLIVFLNPNIDPRGSGWHIIQSMTAIGSGGLFGKGYLHGTQSHYRFLPQQSTDFIFSIFAEEWGLVGGLLVFALFLVICLRLIRIIKVTADPFGAYIVAGIAGIFIFHFLINVGMAMGIMPITGIPLLFMSYGGSALLCAMAGIGLALSVYIRRYEH